jgi:hypothetical protein
LIEDFALGTAADNVDDFNSNAGEFFQPTQHLAVFQRETLIGAPDQLAWSFGDWLA